MVSTFYESGTIVLPCAKRVYFGYVQVAVDPLVRQSAAECLLADSYEENRLDFRYLFDNLLSRRQHYRVVEGAGHWDEGGAEQNWKWIMGYLSRRMLCRRVGIPCILLFESTH